MPTKAESSNRPKLAGLLPLLLVLAGLGLIIGGLVSGTRSAENGGNEDCPAGTELLAKFDYQGQHYSFSDPQGNESVVQITDYSSTGARWTSQVPVAAIVVKGGPAAVVTTLDPPATTGSFDNSGLPLVGSGQHPDISNVKFCRGTTTPPTTIPGTTTTVPEPTTTVPGESTTTVPSTTSTTPKPTPTTAQSNSSGSQGGLAFTGARTLTMTAVGAAMVIAGTAMALIARRRRGRD